MRLWTTSWRREWIRGLVNVWGLAKTSVKLFYTSKGTVTVVCASSGSELFAKGLQCTVQLCGAMFNKASCGLQSSGKIGKTVQLKLFLLLIFCKMLCVRCRKKNFVSKLIQVNGRGCVHRPFCWGVISLNYRLLIDATNKSPTALHTRDMHDCTSVHIMTPHCWTDTVQCLTMFLGHLERHWFIGRGHGKANAIPSGVPLTTTLLHILKEIGRHCGLNFSAEYHFLYFNVYFSWY